MPEPQRAWELADEKIRELRDKIEAVARGEHRVGNPAVMWDQLDKWLEYRHAHGPDDLRGEL